MSNYEKGVVPVADLIAKLELMKQTNLAQALGLIKRSELGPETQGFIAECAAFIRTQKLVESLARFEVGPEIRRVGS